MDFLCLYLNINAILSYTLCEHDTICKILIIHLRKTDL